MKKTLACFIAVILILSAGFSLAASYTLPEKMHNQLAIGSGLKGTFRITTEGVKTVFPFLNAISDAEFNLRGMSSGDDFHYYVFQTDEKENQSALSELYRTNGVCYFRSDMVQGKILALPTAESFADSLLPVKNGENPSMAPFLMKILTLSENEYEDRWKPILTRYQNELEMWLADFTVQADVVKQENGSSALVFTYEIPMDQVKQQMMKLFQEMITDPEFSDLLASVMTEDEKAVYANGTLMYYYQESLDSLDLSGEIKMNKRVSAMGEVLSSMIELPLDERTTGYQSLIIENNGSQSVFRLQNRDRTIVLAIPSGINGSAEEKKSVWFTSVSSSDNEAQANISVRIDIQKSSREYNDEEEKSHLEEKYEFVVRQDEEYLPEGFDKTRLPDTDEIHAELNLHYYSKFSQNSATTLEINAMATQGDLSISFEGKFKTAAPWLFMPFELIDPIQIDPANPQELMAYFADWISNAPSIIHHSEKTETSSSDQNDTTQSEPQETSGVLTDQPSEGKEEQNDNQTSEQTEASGSETAEPLDEQSRETESEQADEP